MASGIAAPSRTAMMAAMGRAMHLIHYGRRALLADWLARPLVGPMPTQSWLHTVR
jgi:hypothetical protein